MIIFLFVIVIVIAIVIIMVAIKMPFRNPQIISQLENYFHLMNFMNIYRGHQLVNYLIFFIVDNKFILVTILNPKVLLLNSTQAIVKKKLNLKLIRSNYSMKKKCTAKDIIIQMQYSLGIMPFIFLFDSTRNEIFKNLFIHYFALFLKLSVTFNLYIFCLIHRLVIPISLYKLHYSPKELLRYNLKYRSMQVYNDKFNFKYIFGSVSSQ